MTDLLILDEPTIVSIRTRSGSARSDPDLASKRRSDLDPYLSEVEIMCSLVIVILARIKASDCRKSAF